jgi:TonB family protein
MFLDFYGFREQPFGVTPDPRFLYLSPMHREALASLYYGIEAGRGFLSMIARPGMGKTTLLFQLLEEFRNAARTAFLFQTQCDSREFIRFLLAELGIDTKEQDRVKMHEEFNSVLLREMKAGKRFVVVIDEAQNLDDSVLETVRLLSNFETPRAKLMQIILSGQPELADKLARPNLSQLRQRISIVARLEPLPPQNVHEYIQHRLRVVGYSGPRLFLPDAEAEIIERSEGIPRTINNLCFNSLSLGYALGKRQIDRGLVQEIAADLNLESIASRPRAPQFSIPFNSPIFETPSRWMALDVPSPEVASQITQVSTPANGNGHSHLAEVAIADAELPQPVSGSNPTIAATAEEVSSVISPRIESVSAAPGVSTPTVNAPYSETDSSFVKRPSPSPVRSVYMSPPARVSSTSKTPLQVVIRNDKAPKTKLGKLAKPLIFGVLALDITLGTIFLIHQRGSQATDNRQPAAASVLGTIADEGSLVSDENDRSRNTIPLRIAVPASVMKENLVRMVPPTSPPNTDGVSESVLVQAIIGRDGNVRSVRVLDGDPQFAKAATQAVMQWRYKPYRVNGQPADVDTQITVNFNSADNRPAR